MVKTLKVFLSQADPKNKFKIISLVSTALFVVFVSGASIFWILKSKMHPPLAERVLERSRELASESPAYSFQYEIKDMSIPLTNYKHTRSAFAQFTLILDCPSEEAKKRMTTVLPKLLDTILVVGSNFYVEDFEPPLSEKGFFRFKTELKNAYQKFLNNDAPREVVFKDWFVN